MAKRTIVIESNPRLAQGFVGPEWSPELSLEMMARNKIGTAVVSCAIPCTVLVQEAAEAATLSREINEFMASLRDQHPSQLGFFATLPSLTDVQSCIDEIRYSISELKADGVAIYTSYGEKYLGDNDFAPVWDELNKHATVVFIHPTMEGMEKSIKEPFLIPRALIDWPHETTRTAIHLIMTNTLRKFPECKVILSHGGGTLPYVAGRIADIPIQTRLSGKSPEEFLEDAKSFYFDLALVGYGAPISLLMDFAAEGHVLYGSDYPFVRENGVVKQLEVVDVVGVGETEELTAPLTETTRQAALALFPQRKSALEQAN